MTDPSSTRPHVPDGLAVASGWAWRLLVLAFAIGLVCFVAFELRVVTVPIFIAILLSTLLIPPVKFLEKRGFKPAAATGTVFLVVVLLAALIIYLLASPVASQFSDLGPQVTKAIDQVQNWLQTGPLDLSQQQIDDYITKARTNLSANASSLGAGVAGGATIIGEVIVGIFVTLVLTFFFTKDGDKISNSIIGLLPDRHQEKAHAAAHRSFTILGGYLKGVAMTGIVDAVLIGIALLIVGVPLVLPLVILTFFGAFFPVVGATVAGAVAASVALVNGGVVDAAIIVGAVIVIQQVEGHLLQPLLVGRAVKLHPSAIIVSLVTGSLIAGIIGAFIAVPLVAVVVGIIRELRNMRPAQITTSPGGDTVGS